MPKDTRERLAVATKQLRRICDPVEPDAAPDPTAVIGQAEALASVTFGLEMFNGQPYATSHYNVVVTGPPDSGRTTKTLGCVSKYAEKAAAMPPDLVVLPNFDNPHRPLPCYIPNGTGRIAADKLLDLRYYMLTTLPRAMAKHQEILTEEHDAKLEAIWQDAASRINKLGFLIIQNPGGYVCAAASLIDPDRPMTQEEGNHLQNEDKEAFDRLFGEQMPQAHAIFGEARDKTIALKKEYEEKREKESSGMAAAGFNLAAETIRELIGENEKFDAYLDNLRDMAVRFALEEPKPEPTNPMEMMARMRSGGEDGGEAAIQLMTTLNVQVDNAGVIHPPVVYVKSPKWSKLFGTAMPESISRDSIKFDHTMVECGEFLKANGGFLVIDLNDLLRDGGGATLYKLLHVIHTRHMKVETMAQFYDYPSYFDFQSEEIDVSVRVVAICSSWLAHVLRFYEPRFANLFRIDSQFDNVMTFEEAPAAYSAFVEICREQQGLRPFSPEAVAKLVEYGARRVADQHRVTTKFGLLKDIITEADFLAGKDDALCVYPEHVRSAIKNRFDRSTLWARKYRRYMDEGILLEHEGDVVGQINGLVVLGAHQDFAIGAPWRITCRVFKGDGEVVLVQREVGNSGESSDTAVQTISGWLNGRFGTEKTLGLGVQISFEQCYGGIDGDSASLAEAVVIMSAITGLPIDQRLAITGSMNQLGEAQPIGGQNEKIEGHFDWLMRQGALKPDCGCGVALPRRNLNGLMLKEEVVLAQKEGLYQVYALDTVEDALEIFLGRPADEIYALASEKLKGDKPSRFKKIIKSFKKAFGV